MTHAVHKGLTKMQLERLEKDRSFILRKTSDIAYDRMRTRTAREQLLAAQQELARGQDDVIPDADDSSWSNKFQ